MKMRFAIIVCLSSIFSTMIMSQEIIYNKAEKDSVKRSGTDFFNRFENYYYEKWEKQNKELHNEYLMKGNSSVLKNDLNLCFEFIKMERIDLLKKIYDSKKLSPFIKIVFNNDDFPQFYVEPNNPDEFLKFTTNKSEEDTIISNHNDKIFLQRKMLMQVDPIPRPSGDLELDAEKLLELIKNVLEEKKIDIPFILYQNYETSQGMKLLSEIIEFRIKFLKFIIYGV